MKLLNAITAWIVKLFRGPYPYRPTTDEVQRMVMLRQLMLIKRLSQINDEEADVLRRRRARRRKGNK